MKILFRFLPWPYIYADLCFFNWYDWYLAYRHISRWWHCIDHVGSETSPLGQSNVSIKNILGPNFQHILGSQIFRISWGQIDKRQTWETHYETFLLCSVLVSTVGWLKNIIIDEKFWSEILSAGGQIVWSVTSGRSGRLWIDWRHQPKARWMHSLPSSILPYNGGRFKVNIDTLTTLLD